MRETCTYRSPGPCPTNDPSPRARPFVRRCWRTSAFVHSWLFPEPITGTPATSFLSCRNLKVQELNDSQLKIKTEAKCCNCDKSRTASEKNASELVLHLKDTEDTSIKQLTRLRLCLWKPIVHWIEGEPCIPVFHHSTEPQSGTCVYQPAAQDEHSLRVKTPTTTKREVS